jgi:prepilin-type N-terminal cleavage/methylation domain-containing protein
MTGKKGFTLIELLLVTSIISLLSTIVMSAIGQARGEALLAVVGQEIDNLQKESQIYYTDRGFYAADTSGPADCSEANSSWGFLGTDKAKELVDSIRDNSGDIGAQCATTFDSWAIIFETNTSLAYDLGLINTVYAQSETGTICIDSAKRVMVDIENSQVSAGEGRAKLIRLEQNETTGKFACGLLNE